MESSPALFWGIFAAALAVALETLFKTSGTLSYWRLAPVALPGAVAVNYGIFRLVRSSPSILAAIVIFSASTLVLRTLISLALGQRIGLGTWLAAGCMVVAVALRCWRP